MYSCPTPPPPNQGPHDLSPPAPTVKRRAVGPDLSLPPSLTATSTIHRPPDRHARALTHTLGDTAERQANRHTWPKFHFPGLPHTTHPTLVPPPCPAGRAYRGSPPSSPVPPGLGELALPCPHALGLGSHPPRTRWCTCYCWTFH